MAKQKIVKKAIARKLTHIQHEEAHHKKELTKLLRKEVKKQ